MGSEGTRIGSGWEVYYGLTLIVERSRSSLHSPVGHTGTGN
jgi:hypothetical protein